MAPKKRRPPVPIGIDPDLSPEEFAKIHPSAAPRATPTGSAGGGPASSGTPARPKAGKRAPAPTAHPPQPAARSAPQRPRQDVADPRALVEAQHAAQEARYEAREAQQLLQEAREALAQEKAARQAAEKREKAAETKARKRTTEGAKPGRHRAARKKRGPVHEELQQIALRLPPGVMAKLEATIAAYGLDRSAGIRVAITEWYVQARAKGLIPEEDEGSGR